MSRRILPTGPDTTAVITGAAGGIGRAIADVLVARGGFVVLTDIDLERAHRAAAEINGAAGSAVASAFQLDVTDPAAFDALIQRVLHDHGRIDCLVNNAGIADAGEAQELTSLHWSRVLDVNLGGTLNGVRAAYPAMVKQGSGQIVNIASIGGLLPMPLFLPYNTSKFGVTGLTLGLRAEAATHGVGVTLVCPGVIETSLLDTTGPAGTSPPATAPNVRSFITQFMGRPRPAADLATRVLAGLERDEPIVIYPRRARLAAIIMRLSPRLVLRVTEFSVRQEQRGREEEIGARGAAPRRSPLIAVPWKSGPATRRSSPVVVSATRTEIHRWRDLPGIVRGGHQLRRRWPVQPGAIEMKIWLQPLRRVSWTVSVWASKKDLNEFVRSAHHVAVLTPYKTRVTLRGTTWTTTSTDRDGLWREARNRLSCPTGLVMRNDH